MAMAHSASSNQRNDRQRFTDVGEEPDKVLSPLPPIVQSNFGASSSLYEVVKPLYHLIEDLSNRVSYSLGRCKHPKDGLTIDESAAIFLYTQQWPYGKTSFYTVFNRTLRDENRAKFVPFYPYLNLFMSACHKLPSIQDRIWRGETGHWGAMYQPGTIHVWWGVSSCTDMIRVTGDFLDQTKTRTLFNIKCINGKIIKNHSEFPNESETVLPPGTYLKVKSLLNVTHEMCIVDLEEIVPTSEEIAQLKATTIISGRIPKIQQDDSIHVLWLDPKVFEKLGEAINYIQNQRHQRFLLITAGQIGRVVVPQINDLSQLKFIVIYCMNKEANEEWSKDYPKVKAVVVDEDEMIKTVQHLQKDLVEQHESVSREPLKYTNSRCLDTVNKSQQELRPLYGIVDQPLVSLQESLQEITHIIPHLQYHIYTAMTRSEKPADGLTQNESAAIHIYTMEWEPSETCLYLLLNQDLRSGSQTTVKKWFPYMRLFLRALNKLPPYKGAVYRGANLNLSDQYKTGQTGTWWNFASASASRMSFISLPEAPPQQGSFTQIAIECTNGKCIKKHSNLQVDDEILLLPGFSYEVTSNLYIGNERYLLLLKETDSSYELFEECTQQEAAESGTSTKKIRKKFASFLSEHFSAHK